MLRVVECNGYMGTKFSIKPTKCLFGVRCCGECRVKVLGHVAIFGDGSSEQCGAGHGCLPIGLNPVVTGKHDNHTRTLSRCNACIFFRIPLAFFRYTFFFLFPFLPQRFGTACICPAPILCHVPLISGLAYSTKSPVGLVSTCRPGRSPTAPLLPRQTLGRAQIPICLPIWDCFLSLQNTKSSCVAVVAQPWRHVRSVIFMVVAFHHPNPDSHKKLKQHPLVARVLSQLNKQVCQRIMAASRQNLRYVAAQTKGVLPNILSQIPAFDATASSLHYLNELAPLDPKDCPGVTLADHDPDAGTKGTRIQVYNRDTLDTALGIQQAPTVKQLTSAEDEAAPSPASCKSFPEIRNVPSNDCGSHIPKPQSLS